MAGLNMLIATVIANALWAGLLAALTPDQLLPPERRFRGLRTAVTAFTIPHMLLAGLLIDYWGPQTTLLLGCSLSALAFLAFDRATSRWAALGSAALLAGAISTLAVASIVMMPQAFGPATHAARAVNLGSLGLAAGWMLAGSISHRLMARLQLRRTLMILALASLVPATLVAFVPSSESPESAAVGEAVPLLTDPRLGLVMLMMALSLPMEALLGRWAACYLRELGYLSGAKSIIGAGFWLAFFGARVGAGCLLPARGEAVWVLAMTVLAATTLGNLLGAYGGRNTRVGVWLVGASVGSLVPTILALTLKAHPEATGPATGMSCAAGMLGILLLLPWINAPENERSTHSLLKAATILAGLLLVPTLILAVLG